MNEDTLWAGGPYDPSYPGALSALPEARKLVFEGKYKEAEDYIDAHMMAHPLREMPYQPLANLVIDSPETTSVSGYRRELNLDSAIASTTYTAQQVKYRREVFISPIDQVIVVHMAADKPGQINCTIGLQTEQEAAIVTETPATLLLTGKNQSAQGIAGALKFQARVRAIAKGGTIAASANALSVKGADSATILIAAFTSYKSYKDVSGDPQALTKMTLSAASKRSYEQLRARSVAEHQRLFRRVHINLGNSSVREEVPTDERIAKFNSSNDPQLAALYFQFGRYLLISSSRPGTQPATLQAFGTTTCNRRGRVSTPSTSIQK
jgi:alpha-L-fucosidase 2